MKRWIRQEAGVQARLGFDGLCTSKGLVDFSREALRGKIVW